MEKPNGSELKDQRENLALQSEMPKMIKEREKRKFSSNGRKLDETFFPETQVEKT